MWSNFVDLSWNVCLEEEQCLYHTHPPSKFPHIGGPEGWEIPMLSAGRGAKEQMYIAGHCHTTFWFDLFFMVLDKEWESVKRRLSFCLFSYILLFKYQLIFPAHYIFFFILERSRNSFPQDDSF